MREIKLLYFDEWLNFGDELNMYITQQLHGRFTCSKRFWCNAVFVGSMLERFISNYNILVRAFFLALPRVNVWGTGYLLPPAAVKSKLLRRLYVRACRGRLTLERLERQRFVKVSNDVVLADPGLLAGRLIDTSMNEKKYALGIILHYHDKGDPLVEKITAKNTILIDIQQEPEPFMHQVSQCKHIISSAMHGLIAADSLGIPNARMVLSKELPGGDYKFNDYYSAFELESHTIVDLKQREFDDNDLLGIKEHYAIKPEQVKQKQDALLGVFPFDNPKLKACRGVL
jgi:hypothetical protein